MSDIEDNIIFYLHIDKNWKVCRRILGPVYDNEKENWRILTKNKICAIVKNPTITEVT
jgi:hypothetical protein